MFIELLLLRDAAKLAVRSDFCYGRSELDKHAERYTETSKMGPDRYKVRPGLFWSLYYLFLAAVGF